MITVSMVSSSGDSKSEVSNFTDVIDAWVENKYDPDQKGEKAFWVDVRALLRKLPKDAQIGLKDILAMIVGSNVESKFKAGKYVGIQSVLTEIKRLVGSTI